jgi:hypothetical protein
MVDADEEEQSIQIIELPVVGFEPDVEHTLVMRIDTAGTSATKYTDRVAYVWDGRLKRPDGTEQNLDVVSITGTAERGPYAVERGFTAAAFHAGDNTQWRVRDHVDGTLTKFPLASKSFDEEVHERFIESTCRSFKEAGQPCLEVFWANDQWGMALVGQFGEPSVLPYLHAAQDHSDGIVLWAPTTNLHDTTKGHLSQRQPWDDELHSVAVGFGSYTLPVPGWYHRWTVTAPEDGEYTVHWSEAAAFSVPEERLYRTLSVNGITAHEVGLGTPEAEASFASFSASAGDTIDVGVDLRSGFGFAYFATQLGLAAPSGDAIDLYSAVHTSGANAGSERSFGCLTRYFTSSDHADACDTTTE